MSDISSTINNIASTIQKIGSSYVSTVNSGAYDGLSYKEKQMDVKPVINKSIETNSILGMSSLTFVSFSLISVFVMGVSILILKPQIK